MTITFTPLTQNYRKIVHSWLEKPHVAEFFHGEGLQNTYKHIDQFLEGQGEIFEHWLGFLDGKPFSFLMTSNVDSTVKDYAEWLQEDQQATTLDLLIGEEKLLGKGLGAKIIRQFLLAYFPHKKTVFIDPEVRNERATYVYEKVGFKKLGQFKPEYDPVLHWMMKLDLDQLKVGERCFGNGKEFYADYHDHEWGIPQHDDQHLFEMLLLEGNQAGLSWETILKKRPSYRKLFYNFDPVKVSKMTDEELETLCGNSDIIRNRRKIFAARQNAHVFLKIQEEHGSFSSYLWEYVKGKPIINYWKTFEEVPASTSLSDRIAADLKKRGMTFVGTKIIYAYLQAVGVINDHLLTCRCR